MKIFCYFRLNVKRISPDVANLQAIDETELDESNANNDDEEAPFEINMERVSRLV